MRHIAIHKLGLAADTGLLAENRSRLVQLGGRKVYGVAIGTDSELDQCAIGIRGMSDPGQFTGYQMPQDTYTATAESDNVIQSVKADHVKVAVGAAWVGLIDTAALIVSATRGIRAAVTLSSPSPVLTLDLAESPDEAIALAARTRRAPLDIPISVSLATAGSRTLIFPTYGRAWWSFAFDSAAAAGTPVRTVTLQGQTEVLFTIAGGLAVYTNQRLGKNTSPSLVSVTGTADREDSYEGDSSWDRMTASFSCAAPGAVDFTGHFRAEDA